MLSVMAIRIAICAIVQGSAVPVMEKNIFMLIWEGIL